MHPFVEGAVVIRRMDTSIPYSYNCCRRRGTIQDQRKRPRHGSRASNTDSPATRAITAVAVPVPVPKNHHA
jgi:hypothetical protein